MENLSEQGVILRHCFLNQSTLGLNISHMCYIFNNRRLQLMLGILIVFDVHHTLFHANALNWSWYRCFTLVVPGHHHTQYLSTISTNLLSVTFFSRTHLNSCTVALLLVCPGWAFKPSSYLLNLFLNGLLPLVLFLRWTLMHYPFCLLSLLHSSHKVLGKLL